MNAVEIEAALSDLSVEPFDAEEFPYQFLAAFGNKEVALKRLRTGNNNASDLPNGVLLRNNIHLATCEVGKVAETLQSLRLSPTTVKAKAKFILATDGERFDAEELITGEVVTSLYTDFPNHFGMFFPLAGLSTFKEIKDNPIDVRATGRLNKLYVELLRENPEWAKAERRGDMNHFMSRLIFCFFAEDTGIFNSTGLFSKTVEQMSERDGSNAHEVLEAVFRAMNIKTQDRATAHPKLPNWAGVFPYVNGGLFSGSTEVPRFSRIARTYLSHAANLNWKEINPDIFGSMIQAVADDEERGALGMHYTSVPNILKVLNPLFLDDLRAQLEVCGDNKAKLLNLRKRMARIRVFDPACGSGNFLVIAYKQMREIEAEINRRRGEEHLGSEIPLTNFRGIELRDFPAEIARLALIIAEFQCDVLYRGQQDALAEFLPLDAENWIVSGNALRLDWVQICPPTGTGVKVVGDDLFNTPLDQKEIDFENEGGETYICGNPPYVGKGKKSPQQIDDMESVFGRYGVKHGYIDYVGGWFMKAAEYAHKTSSSCAFVTTNSLCQGHQVPLIWPLLFKAGQKISFAHASFKWSNLASKNAGVTVAIIGLSSELKGVRKLFSISNEGLSIAKEVQYINAYLVGGSEVMVEKRSNPLSALTSMDLGNMPYDGGNLLLTRQDLIELELTESQQKKFIRRIYGSQEFIGNIERYCLWIEDANLEEARKISSINSRIEAVRAMRLSSSDSGGRAMAARSHQLREMRVAQNHTVVMPRTSSEARPYLPAGLLQSSSCVSSEAFALFDAPLWQLALLTSRLHLIWIATVCGQLETRYRYSNVLGWNTFPVPILTEQNKIDMTQSAESILFARESHFPATIADLYEVKDGVSRMPENLRLAHETNDEVIERIYIGRRFKNDTERLEKLFELYIKMAANATASKKGKK
jgi:hypothetical protein